MNGTKKTLLAECCRSLCLVKYNMNTEAGRTPACSLHRNVIPFESEDVCVCDKRDRESARTCGVTFTLTRMSTVPYRSYFTGRGTEYCLARTQYSFDRFMLNNAVSVGMSFIFLSEASMFLCQITNRNCIFFTYQNMFTTFFCWYRYFVQYYT